MEIRYMQECDIGKVSAIERKTFSRPWSEKDFYDAVHKRDCIYLVAVKEEEVAGYCGMWCVAGEGQITNVAVAEQYRGQQVATQLLEKLLEEGENRGNYAFTLEVRVSNLPAISLYEKFRFENAGIRKNFYEAPREDGMIMWKR